MKPVARSVLVLATGVALLACENTPTEIIWLGDIELNQVSATGFVPEALGPQEPRTLRFALVTPEYNVMVPGTDLSGIVVEPGVTLTTDNLRMEDARLHPIPDMACAADNDCAMAEGGTCVEGLCGWDSEVELVEGSVGLEGDPADPFSVLVAVVSSSSVLGLDTSVAPPRIDRALSSDPLDRRAGTAQQLVGALERHLGAAESEVCLSGFAGLSQNSLRLVGGVDDCFVAPVGEGAELLRERASELGRAVYESQGERSLWAVVLAGVGSLETRAPENRALVIITDGGDQSSIEELGETLPDAIDAALVAGVPVHVIHFDSGPMGLQGPNVDLRELSEATGGFYRYVEEPSDMLPLSSALGVEITGHYEVDVRLDALAELPAGTYRVDADFGVAISQKDVDYHFEIEMGDDNRPIVFVE